MVIEYRKLESKKDERGVRMQTRVALIFLSVLFLVVLTTLAFAQPSSSPSATTRYIAPGGNCGGPTPCYANVQAAVDAASPGDLIKVAEGVYTDIHARAGVTQVVYITKTVTIQGGYTSTDWLTPDPTTHPTTLDAQGQGRVLYITGAITATLDGLRLTGGFASGATDGGGIYAANAAPTLTGCQVFSNTASGGGGGLYLYYSSATLISNTIISNTSSDVGGGGLYLSHSPATLISNTISANTVGEGGCGSGLYLFHSPATLTANTISANGLADGAIYVDASAASLVRNIVTSNNGEGIYLGSSSATLDNNTITDNTVGLVVFDADPHLRHNTIARNTGYNVRMISNTPHTAILTNTIIANSTTGIYAETAFSTILLYGVLWYGNTANIGGAGAITVTHAYTGNPAFDPDGYHILTGSAAIDRGIDAGVTTDIDGDLRPQEAGYDLGADEYVIPTCFARLNNGAIYHSVQKAVDASIQPGDVVKVAGYCASVNSYGGLSQQVYLTKTLTIQGGYTTTNWTTPNPSANPTTLDAQGQGRVLYVAGAITVTLDGLRLTGGNAAGLGGEGWGVGDYGSGIYINTANVTISRSDIVSNTLIGSADESAGAGIHIYTARVTICQSTIAYNDAGNQGYSGGIYSYESDTTIISNTITHNNGGAMGGGIAAQTSAGNSLIVAGNIITGNRVDGSGGEGGGLSIFGKFSICSAVVSGNVIAHNTGGYGGGISLSSCPGALINNVIVDNQATHGQIATNGSSAHLYHNTIHRTDTAAGWAISSAYFGNYETLTLINTIISNHAIGVCFHAASTVHINGVLWYSNTANYSGPGLITVTHPYTGDPAFVLDGYHILTGSAAIDRGVPADVATDIDGQPRPAGVASDLGADEFYSQQLPTNLAIAGPTHGVIQTTYIFTADVLPVTATPPITYTWHATEQAPQTIISGLSSVVSFTWLSPSTQIITVTARNAAGAVTDTHAINLYTPVQASFTASSTFGLVPLTVVFTNTSTGDYDTSLWNFGDTMTSTLRSPTHTYTAASVYSVTLTISGMGGVDTLTRAKFITVTNVPITGLIAINSSPTMLGQPTTLTATIAAGRNVNYEWAFGDGTFGDGAALTHTFTDVGVYSAIVTASNSVNVITATTIVTITESKVYLPLMARNYSIIVEVAEAPDSCPGYSIVSGMYYRENFDFANDNDLYQFTAAAGQTYSIQTSDLESLADTVIALYGPDCTTQLAENDDRQPGDLSSLIVWPAPAAGVYHVKVRNRDWRVYGEQTGYTLLVSTEASR